MESRLDWDKFTRDEEVFVMKPGGRGEERGQKEFIWSRTF